MCPCKEKGTCRPAGLGLHVFRFTQQGGVSVCVCGCVCKSGEEDWQEVRLENGSWSPKLPHWTWHRKCGEPLESFKQRSDMLRFVFHKSILSGCSVEDEGRGAPVKGREISYF